MRIPSATFEDTLNAILQATVSIANASDLKNVLQQITDVSREVIQAEYAAMGLFDINGNLTDFMYSGISETAFEKLPRFSDNQVIAEIIQSNQSLRICNTDNQPPAYPSVNGIVDSFLGVPIQTAQKISGAIFLANKQEDRAFSDLDQQIVEIFASHAAIALRKAMLLENSQQQQQELHQRNVQLAVLNTAAMAIAGELALDSVLQQIVDSARKLVGAQYAALGVPNEDGYLESFIHSGMPEAEVEKMPHLPQGLGLLGAITQSKEAIRLKKIQDDPRSVGFPADHPPMTSFIGVPVMAAGQTLGNLYLTNKHNADEFSEDDLELVEMLAAHAAIAIQNARLYEQVGRLAIIEERTRIGMDLHDGIIQSIYAVGLTLESTRLAMHEDNVEEADLLIGSAIDALNDTIRDIRNFILDLRPHRFRGNLRQGLSRLIREFQANAMVVVSLSAPEGAFQELPTSVARAIFLTTQEALANVARHAKATDVTIDVQRTHSHITIVIADNGQGFDVRASKDRVGHGLSNMRARMEELKGKFELKSKASEGTTITLKLPVR